MKSSRARALRLLVLGLLLLGPLLAGQSFAASAEARLVLARNEAGPSDPQLGAYLDNLQRVFRYQQYTQLRKETKTLVQGRDVFITLSNGHALQVQQLGVEGVRIRAQVRWIQNGESHVNTTVLLQPGVPVILGGPRHGNGTLIVILTAQ